MIFMNPEISVIICTHNPRMDYLDRVLEALRLQTLSLDRWELVFVDNASSYDVAINLDWQPQARIVREEELGVTQARLTGIREARGELVVFVDDDNILNTNYLDSAIRIASNWPQLGSWSGRVVPEFEVQPADYLRPHLWRICIREISSDIWGNTGEFNTMPWGAGMCMRRKILNQYRQEAYSKPEIPGFSRRGEQFLASGEDVHIAEIGLAMGYGCGVFCSLELTHLIPKRRVQEAYLLKLIEDSEAGSVVYEWLKTKSFTSKKSFVDRIVDEYKFLRASTLQKKIELAIRRGRRRGQTIVHGLHAN